MTTAVLGNEGLLYAQKGQWVQLEASPRNTVELADVCAGAHIENLWITPGSQISDHMLDHPDHWIVDSDALPEADRLASYAHYRTRTREYGGKQYPISFSVTRTVGEKKTTRIYVPQLDDRWSEDKINGWSLAQCENPKVLLLALGYLERAFGIAIGGPGYTGIELMRKTTEMHPHYWRAFDHDMLPPLIETDILWHRPLTPREQLSKYLHIYDKTAMYQAAGTGCKMGVGAPLHCTVLEHYDELEQGILKNQPGVWKISVGTVPGYWFGERFMPDSIIWAYSPVVAELMRQGYAPRILEGYCWREHHETLRPWSELLWKLRADLRINVQKYPNREAALHAQKMNKIIGVQGIGWLDLTSSRAKPHSERGFHHPDKRNMLIALAKARMLRKIAEMEQQGYPPCMVCVDGLGFISDDPNPVTAVPSIMRRAGELGGFRCEVTLELTTEVTNLFGKKNILLKRELNAIARRKEASHVQTL